MVTRSKISYLNAIPGVELPKSKGPALPQPIAPAPTLAQPMASSETERSAEVNITDMEMTDEEIDMEHSGSVTREEKTLLVLRQQYKKVSTNMARVKSHLSFLQECQGQNRIPKGLRVNVKCNALLADYTTVKEQFKSTKETAEGEFTESLKEHYELVKANLTTELKKLESDMERGLSKINDEAKKEHLDLMKKTTDNITKHEERLQNRKKLKYEHLCNPEARRGRDREGDREEREDRGERRWRNREDRSQDRGRYKEDRSQDRRSRDKRNPAHQTRPDRVGRGMPYSNNTHRQYRPGRESITPPIGEERANQHTNTVAQPAPPTPNVVQEMAEMKRLINQLLINQSAPPIQQPPHPPGMMMNHCIPQTLQPPSLLGPGTGALPGQHPSLVRPVQQCFQPRDRLHPQQPYRNP